VHNRNVHNRSRRPATAKYKRKAFRFNDDTVGAVVSLSHDKGIGRTVVEWRDVGTVGLTIRDHARQGDVVSSPAGNDDPPVRREPASARSGEVYRKAGPAGGVHEAQPSRRRGRASELCQLPESYASEKELARFDRDTEARIEHGLVQLEKARRGPVSEAKPFWT
jgi:hypothetical protein